MLSLQLWESEHYPSGLRAERGRTLITDQFGQYSPNRPSGPRWQPLISAENCRPKSGLADCSNGLWVSRRRADSSPCPGRPGASETLCDPVAQPLLNSSEHPSNCCNVAGCLVGAEPLKAGEDTWPNAATVHRDHGTEHPGVLISQDDSCPIASAAFADDPNSEGDCV